MSITAIGRQGEVLALRMLKGYPFYVDIIFQADWLIYYKNAWIVVEVKHKEMFTAGRNIPFDGHGLPPYQVEARNAFYRDTGIPCLLLVIDKGVGDPRYVYFQFLHKLEKGRWKDTSINPCRIYDIQSFEKAVYPFDPRTNPNPAEVLDRLVQEHFMNQYLDTLLPDDPPF